MKVKVYLKSIQAHELHSRPYDGLKLEDLSDGVTVVYAPNAAGKTVLALAASHVLRPCALTDTDRITACIQIEETIHDVNLRGPRQDAPWPQSARDGLYRLSVADIIVKPSEEDQQRILEALAGGISLAGVGACSAGRRPPDIPAAWKELSDRQQKAARLAAEEARLPELEEQLRQARQAKEDAAFLSNWLSASAIEQTIGELDAGIAHIKNHYSGIEKQSDNALALVSGAHSAYGEACEAHTFAESGLDKFGKQKAPRPLQAADEGTLRGYEAEFDQLSGELTSGQIQQQMAILAAEEARRRLADMGAESAPVPLAPADKQTLIRLVERVKQAEESTVKERQRRDDARTACNHAQRNFKDAGGDLDQLPINPAKADDLHRAIELDAEIGAKTMENNHAQAALAEAKKALEDARERLPGAKAPARQVSNLLLQEPRIANLMDAYRKVRIQKEAFDAVAEQLRNQAVEAARGAARTSEAETALRDWLRSVSEPPKPFRKGPLFIVATVSATGAVAVGAVAGWVWGTILAVCGIAALMVVVMWIREVSSVTQLQESAAKRVPPQWQPQSWTCDAVASSLATVIHQIQVAAVLHKLHGEEQAAASALDTDSPREHLEKRIAIFEKETGIKGQNLADYDLANLIHNLQALGNAEDCFASATVHSSNVRSCLESLREALSSLIHATIGAPASITTGAAAKLWADRLDTLRQTNVADRMHEESVRYRQSESESAERDLRGFFERFHWPWAGDAPTAKDQFLRWFEATETANTAVAASEGADDQVAKVLGRLKTVENAIQELLDRYGFPTADGKNARAVTETFREWFKTTDRLNRSEEASAKAKESLQQALSDNGIPAFTKEKELTLEDRRLECQRRAKDGLPKLRELSKQRETDNRERTRLRSQTDWDELFARLGLGNEPSPEAVSAKKDELLGHAGLETEITEKTAGTRALIGAAESANDLQGAQNAMSRAVEQMELWLRRKQEELAAADVVSCISEAVRSEATPVIVRSTNQYLSALSDGRYDRIDVIGSQVYVTDMMEAQKEKRVDQLSTGTRVHLAFALRLAAIEASEANQGYAFPLLLDEVMATSDPDASTAIASALQVVVEKRQVIMFTNQPDDVSVMRRAFGESLLVKTLGHAIVPVVAPPVEAPPVRPQVIPDGGIPLFSSASQWPPNLFVGLIDDLDGRCRTVYEAMSRGNQSQCTRNEAVLAAVEAVRSKVAGACRTLSRSALSGVDWITLTFRERAEKLVDSLGGNPRKFLEGFRDMKSMRSANIEACEHWLLEQNYLTEMPTADELREIASGKLPIDLPGRDDVVSRICGLFVRSAS